MKGHLWRLLGQPLEELQIALQAFDAVNGLYDLAVVLGLALLYVGSPLRVGQGLVLVAIMQVGIFCLDTAILIVEVSQEGEQLLGCL